MDTLVLNRSYMPINRISWQDALCDVFTGRAEIIETYEDWTVSSPSTVFGVPSVIRFLGKVRGMFRRGVKFNRHNVYMRDKGRCQYCGSKVGKNTFTYDHVIPRQQGGRTKWGNIVIACLPCNQRKANRTPQQAKMKLRSKPVRPKSLPGTTLIWEDSMPKSWRDYVTTVSYWHGSLDK